MKILMPYLLVSYSNNIMNKKDRKLLLENRLAFVENVEAEDLLGHLFQDGVLSENDKEKIEVQTTRRDRIELLLDTLPRKIPKAFTKFWPVPRSSPYHFLKALHLERGDQVTTPLQRFQQKLNDYPAVPNRTMDIVLRMDVCMYACACECVSF